MFTENSTNIVLAASQLEPLIFSDSWYINNGVLKAEDIESGKGMITPVVSQVFTKDFYIQVYRDQIAIFFAKHYDAALMNTVKTAFLNIIKASTTLDIYAIGANFHFDSEELDNAETLTRKLSFYEDNRLHKALNSNDTNMRFGSYIKMDFLDSRLRIDIKAYDKPEDISKEFVKVSLNYSIYIKKNAWAEAEQFTSKIDQYISNTKRIISTIEEMAK